MKITAFVKRSILVWGVSCLILPAVGYAQKTDFERFKMPSGLRVLVHRDDRAPVVSVALMYKTGRNDEPSSLEGMNRVVAGMRTEASPHLSVGQYREIMDAYGGKSTIRVDPDVTLFCDSFSSNMLKGAIWLAAEKAYGFREDSQALERVLEDTAGEELSLGRSLESREREALYDMVRTANFRLVPEVAALDSGLTMGAVKTYEALYFNPKNAVLAISGDVDVDSVRRYVVEMFSLLPPDTSGVELRPKVFSVHDQAVDTMEIAPGRTVDVGRGILTTVDRTRHTDTLFVSQPYESVIFAWQIPPYGDPEAAVFDFVSTVLSAGTGSRLYRSLVETDGVATAVRAYFLPMERASVFAFKVSLRPGEKVSQVEPRIRAEVEKLKNFTISPGELKKAINTARMTAWTTVSSHEGMAAALALNELLHGYAGADYARLEKMAGVTADDVRNVVRRFLREDNMKVIYELPVSQTGKNTAGQK